MLLLQLIYRAWPGISHQAWFVVYSNVISCLVWYIARVEPDLSNHIQTGRGTSPQSWTGILQRAGLSISHQAWPRISPRAWPTVVQQRVGPAISYQERLIDFQIQRIVQGTNEHMHLKIIASTR